MRNKGRDIITYWALTPENAYGEKGFVTPITFVGHWEDRNEQMRLTSGEDIISKAIVYVPEEVELAMGGYLVLGDYSEAADPLLVGGQEIQTIINIPSMRTSSNERRAIL